MNLKIAQNYLLAIKKGIEISVEENFIRKLKVNNFIKHKHTEKKEM